MPGFNWLQILVIGRQGPPTLAHFGWWTTRGQHKSTKRKKEERVLRKIDKLWGKNVLHSWDRGFAGNPWMKMVNLANRVKLARVSVPGIIACYGMPADVVIVRWVLSLSRSLIRPTNCLFGWLWLAASTNDHVISILL